MLKTVLTASRVLLLRATIQTTMLKNHRVELKIKYDAIRTDRTQICLIVEEFDGVGGEVIKS